MKTVFALLALAVAAVSAQDAPAPTCAVTELIKLNVLVKNPTNYNNCKPAVQGFSFLPVTGEPNSTQLAGLCTEASCQGVIKELRNIPNLIDCNIVNNAKNVSLNVFRFIRDFDTKCQTYTKAPTPAPTTVAPTPAPTTVAPTPAPEPTVPVKPSC